MFIKLGLQKFIDLDMDVVEVYSLVFFWIHFPILEFLSASLPFVHSYTIDFLKIRLVYFWSIFPIIPKPE